MLLDIDQSNLWHGNSLTHRATYAALFHNAPKTFDVILTNPPFGGKEGNDVQKNFAYETSSTQVLFVQDILGKLAPKGTCAIVQNEGLLFRTNESAFVETKRKPVDECDQKAVNPTAVVDVDTRTPLQIIANVEAQGRILADALARLNTLMVAAEMPE